MMGESNRRMNPLPRRMTRSSHNGQRLPGGFDVLNIRRRHYPAANRWGFPDLLPQRFILPEPRQLLKPDGLRLRKMT